MSGIPNNYNINQNLSINYDPNLLNPIINQQNYHNYYQNNNNIPINQNPYHYQNLNVMMPQYQNQNLNQIPFSHRIPNNNINQNLHFNLNSSHNHSYNQNNNQNQNQNQSNQIILIQAQTPITHINQNNSTHPTLLGNALIPYIIEKQTSASEKYQKIVSKQNFLSIFY
jgi:hypothetical protein